MDTDKHGFKTGPYPCSSAFIRGSSPINSSDGKSYICYPMAEKNPIGTARLSKANMLELVALIAGRILWRNEYLT